jgi:hypothetical protein
MITIPALATDLTYTPVRLSRNRITVNIDALDPTEYPVRTFLRYFLELYVPNHPGSTTYDNIATPEAAEEPVLLIDSAESYRGAFFDIEDILDDYLTPTPPTFNQVIASTAPFVLMPYYFKSLITDEGSLVQQTTHPAEWVLKAGIREEDLAAWGRLLFANADGKMTKFLTWQPDNRKVLPTDQVFLYWLNNSSCSTDPMSLSLGVYYDDGTSEDILNIQFLALKYMTVQCIPVGPIAMGLDELTKTVVKYSLWLTDGEDIRISEVRTFTLDYNYYRKTRQIVFANGLGGYDSLSLTGRGGEKLSVAAYTSERMPDVDALPTYSEIVINKITGERELSVSTGHLSKDERFWLQDLLYSRDIYLATDREFVPLTLVGSDYSYDIDDENRIGRSFTFRYSNKQNNLSKLPIAPPTAARPTGWRAYSSACLLDSFGIRTGYAGTTMLEKYYTDTNERYKPITYKPNTPDTEGYIAPELSEDCEDPAYLSAEYAAPCSYQRNNCTPPLIGSYPTITIAAERWGSELSQEDADAKALEEWMSLNTQAYANANGTCNLYFSAEISAISTYENTTCPGGHTGQGWTITIAAGAYTSGVSQGAADAAAAAAWAALDTQPNADLYGACYYATADYAQTVPSGKWWLKAQLNHAYSGGLTLRYTYPNNGSNGSGYVITSVNAQGNVYGFDWTGVVPNQSSAATVRCRAYKNGILIHESTSTNDTAFSNYMKFAALFGGTANRPAAGERIYLEYDEV